MKCLNLKLVVFPLAATSLLFSANANAARLPRITIGLKTFTPAELNNLSCPVIPKPGVMQNCFKIAGNYGAFILKDLAIDKPARIISMDGTEIDMISLTDVIIEQANQFGAGGTITFTNIFDAPPGAGPGESVLEINGSFKLTANGAASFTARGIINGSFLDPISDKFILPEPSEPAEKPFTGTKNAKVPLANMNSLTGILQFTFRNLGDQIILPGSHDVSIVATPEPSSVLNLLAIGTLGAASALKRKLKPSKSAEKETTKVS